MVGSRALLLCHFPVTFSNYGHGSLSVKFGTYLGCKVELLFLICKCQHHLHN